jgi:hypothetical protein
MTLLRGIGMNTNSKLALRISTTVPTRRLKVTRMLPLSAAVFCGAKWSKMCRFSDAGMQRLSARSDGRRLKSAKARNRGR